MCQVSGVYVSSFNKRGTKIKQITTSTKMHRLSTRREREIERRIEGVESLRLIFLAGRAQRIGNSHLPAGRSC